MLWIEQYAFYPYITVGPEMTLYVMSYWGTDYYNVSLSMCSTVGKSFLIDDFFV